MRLASFFYFQFFPDQGISKVLLPMRQRLLFQPLQAAVEPVEGNKFDGSVKEVKKFFCLELLIYLPNQKTENG